MSNLLNCPFCGAEAKYMEIKDFFISRFVTCTKCGIETPRNCLNRKDAIKRWNTRTPMANIVEKLEEIKGKACDGIECVNCVYNKDCYEGEMSEVVAIDKAINIVKQEINNGLE